MIKQKELDIYRDFKRTCNKTLTGECNGVSARTVGRIVAKIESLPTYNDFNKGDIVEHPNFDCKGKVVEKDSSDNSICVEFNTRYWFFTISSAVEEEDYIGNLVIVTEAEEGDEVEADNICGFRVDDKVVVNISSPFGYFDIGSKGEIEHLDFEDNSVLVRFENGNIWWFFKAKHDRKDHENIVFLEHAKSDYSFKVGDEVVVDIDSPDGFIYKAGDIGVVYSVIGVLVAVNFPEHGSWKFFSDSDDSKFQENTSHLRLYDDPSEDLYDDPSEDVVEDNARYVFVLTQNSVAITRIDGDDVSLRVCDKTHGMFDEIKDKLKENQHQAVVADCFDLIDISAMIERFTVGRIEVDVEAGTVLYKSPETGRVRDVPEDLADHILYTVERHGREDAEAAAKFLDKLMENPSENSIKDLYSFLRDNNLEIDQDGNMIAWKGVRSDMYDVHSGTNLHVIGEEIRVPRSAVDPDSQKPCSFGLHIGSFSYASGWGDATLEVSINPKDVVSCPYRSDFHKLRVCAYTPIKRIN